MTRQRLCFVVESGTDVRLVEGLAQQFELTILARSIPGGVPISQPPECQLAIEVGSASRVSFALLTLRRLASKRSFDVILVQGYALAALVANLTALFRRRPTFMLVCSPTERYYRCRASAHFPGKAFHRWQYVGLCILARLNASLSRHYVVLSQHLAEVVRSHGTRACIDVVPVYGVDTSIFSPATEPVAAIRRRLGLPPTGALLFFSSRVAPEKDSETLLSAFRTLLREGRELWLLHRSGGYREFLDEAKAFGVEERVIATDARHPLKGLSEDYQASDLCIQASREEGLGFSPLEALACGVPVVASAVGGLRETIVDGETGWTYPAGDAGALARAICSALDHPEESRRRAEAGRRLVAERYERTMVFNCLKGVFQAALGRREAKDIGGGARRAGF